MAMIEDLEALVKCESPTEDISACKEVVELAISIADRVTKKSAKVITENGRQVFWLGSDSPKIVLLAHLDTVWPIGSFDHDLLHLKRRFSNNLYPCQAYETSDLLYLQYSSCV